ncbi:hypothetical protein [Flavobacterium sp.]|uniref:hypothetical protein n=1 Tax=Flavobacterium sp. TaxID=239 RepID=UPI0025BAC104|nr:hypothetical protein [Flavobacterium sp.]
MKKILCLFSALALVLTSCSSDDAADASASLKPSKVAYSYSDAKDNYFSEMKYEGNKLVTETDDDGYTIKYHYIDDLISKTEEFGTDKALQSTTEYSYSAGKLASETVKNTGETRYYKTKYTHNGDGSVSFAEFYINAKTGAEEEGGKIGKYTYKDGNLVKYESSFYGKPNSTYTYEYDSKKNPTANVAGIKLLLGMEESASANNVVKITGTSSTSTFVSTFSYLYNDSNFPSEKKQFGNGGALNETAQYTY